MQKIGHLLYLIRKGEIHFVISGIKKRLYSDKTSIGLKKDLSSPHDTRKSSVHFSIRKATREDHQCFQMDRTNFGLHEIIPEAYVAVDKNGSIIYRQWLIGSQYNEEIAKFWDGRYPWLKDDEALSENLFTIPAFRGNGILSEALSRITVKARDFGANHAISFVDVNNIGSLRGCRNAGFYPYVLRREKWLLGKRTVTFPPLTEDIQDYFEKVTQGKGK